MSSRTINLTIPKELLQALDAVAQVEGRTRAEIVREAVQRYVEHRREPPPLLLRLASLAAPGPDLAAVDLDRFVYGKRAVDHK